MSAIAAVAATGREDLAPAIDTMLGAMPAAGPLRAVQCRGNAALGVRRLEWETDAAFRGPAEIARDGALVVAADAALYYRDDLTARLRAARVEPAGVTPAHLILAAYRAWGRSCAQYLEGDFAFVVMDESTGALFAARDVFGRRGLYYAVLSHAIVLASTISGVVAYRSCPRDLDAAALARGFSYLMSGPEDTPYRAVRALPPASCLTSTAGGVPQVGRYWHVPGADEQPASSFDDARLELRMLLARAVSERLAPSGPTALWLSGGYDSPALYGAGKAALRARGEEARLQPISVSFPPGDPGREDEFITDIAAYWGDRVTWLEIGAVPLLGALPERAAAADQPSAHSVESFFGALFASTRDMGARVALQGDGGDQLFAVSHVFFNDLFARGRWRELRREWMAFGFGQQGFRWFLDMVVRPVLERSIFPARNERKLAIEPAPWVQPALLERERMLEKERAAASELRRHCRSDAALETIGALTHPVLPRVVTAFSLQGMTHGVEMRAPLLDRRIVEFALRRPRSERASLGEVKRLLRAAGRGLLPETVLAPRRARTGMLTGYFRESFLADPDGLIERTFRQPVLADLGIVERDALLRAWHEYRGSRGGTLGAMLFGTLHTELWVRARLSTGVPAHGQA